MKKSFLMCALCCVLFYFSQASAYTPPDTLVTKSERLSSLYSSRILRQPSEEQKAYRVKLVKKFNKLQKRYARSESARRDEKIFLYEYLRRHLIGYFAPQTDDLIDDPHFTWTRAPLGFDIIYTPYDTTSLFQTDPDHTYRALLNGSYFSRFEEGNIHSGFLAFGGELYTTFVGDDPQLTHTFCMTQGGEIDFIANADFTNDLVKRCHRGFQAGPWIYSERDGSVVVKNTSPNRYIGLPHERTVMVIFTRTPDTKIPLSSSEDIPLQKGGLQELWFLTISHPVTLSEVIDIVQLESRFRGTYIGVEIFNLDGGSSVGYVNHVYPSLNFGKSKKLPIVFGIK